MKIGLVKQNRWYRCSFIHILFSVISSPFGNAFSQFSLINSRMMSKSLHTTPRPGNRAPPGHTDSVLCMKDSVNVSTHPTECPSNVSLENVGSSV